MEPEHHDTFLTSENPYSNGNGNSVTAQHQYPDEPRLSSSPLPDVISSQRHPPIATTTTTTITSSADRDSSSSDNEIVSQWKKRTLPTVKREPAKRAKKTPSHFSAYVVVTERDEKQTRLGNVVGGTHTQPENHTWSSQQSLPPQDPTFTPQQQHISSSIDLPLIATTTTTTTTTRKPKSASLSTPIRNFRPTRRYTTQNDPKGDGKLNRQRCPPRTIILARAPVLDVLDHPIAKRHINRLLQKAGNLDFTPEVRKQLETWRIKIVQTRRGKQPATDARFYPYKTKNKKVFTTLAAKFLSSNLNYDRMLTDGIVLEGFVSRNGHKFMGTWRFDQPQLVDGGGGGINSFVFRPDDSGKFDDADAVVCSVCRSGNTDEDDIIACDLCDVDFHTACASTSIRPSASTKDPFYCPQCSELMRFSGNSLPLPLPPTRNWKGNFVAFNAKYVQYDMLSLVFDYSKLRERMLARGGESPGAVDMFGESDDDDANEENEDDLIATITGGDNKCVVEGVLFRPLTRRADRGGGGRWTTTLCQGDNSVVDGFRLRLSRRWQPGGIVAIRAAAAAAAAATAATASLEKPTTNNTKTVQDPPPPPDLLLDGLTS